MEKKHSPDSKALAWTNSIWITSSITIIANAVFLAVIADGAIELAIAGGLTATLGFIAWRIFSNQRNAKKNFDAKEAQLQFIFDSVPIGLHWVSYRNEDSGAIAESRLFNRAHQNASGLSVEESKVPGAFEKITHPDDIAKQKEVRKQLVQGNMQEVSLEKRYLRKDGSYKWVKVSWKRQYDEDKIGFKEISCIVDITAIKEANETIRQKEIQLRSIFKSVPIGLHLSEVDVSRGIEDKRIVACILNPAHQRLTGLDEEKSKNLGAYDEVSVAEEIEVERKEAQRTIDKGDGSFSMEKRYLHPDGTTVWVLITWIRNWSDDLKSYQEIRTLVDITEQKQFSAKLEQARNAAEQANVSKSQFLATMSHEIRTPMNGMLGMLHLLEPNLDQENLRYLKIAQNSANDLLALINDILDFSKIEAGKMEFECLNFPVEESIDQACEIHANNAFEKGLEFRCEIDPDAAVAINGDPLRLRQVLSNLLSNAVKFTERGEIVLGAKRISTEPESDVLEIYVQDTGIGMATDVEKKLFQAFTQAHASTTRKYGGTGLGLSICKSIVEYMGGSIGVVSDPDKGSKFWIRFPIPHQSPEQNLASPFNQKKRPKILIIENCTDTANYIQLWLEHWGCQSRIAKDTASALEIIGSFKNQSLIDVIFINASLLSHGNKTWHEFLGNSEAIRNAQIVSMDRLSNQQGNEQPHHVSTQLSKPINVRRLREIIEKPRDSRDAPTQPPHAIATNDMNDCKVLVVEDIHTNRIVVTQLLSIKHNIKADTASNGIEAIESIKTKPYDLILMDCMMPEMDGYQATRAIRDGKAGQANRDIPIIALTANAMQDDQDLCIEAGMNDHISKPITPDQITKMLFKWVIEKDRAS